MVVDVRIPIAKLHLDAADAGFDESNSGEASSAKGSIAKSSLQRLRFGAEIKSFDLFALHHAKSFLGRGFMERLLGVEIHHTTRANSFSTTFRSPSTRAF